MNALISASDIKTFHSALQCLSRFSETFWLHCSPSSSSSSSATLRLSAINATNSAFCMFAFDPDFFLRLTLTGPAKVECQIPLKSLLSILRTRGRSVERLELRLTEGEVCRFTVTLHCQHGIVKTHHLTYEPKRGLLPTADPNPPNYFLLNPSTASEWLDHFLSSSRTGEITLLCTPNSCIARSKEEDIPDKSGTRRAIATEVKVAVEEFKEYSVLEDVRLTLSLREFKATVGLAEGWGVGVEVCFGQGDEPLFVRLRVESAVAAEFVIATTKGGGEGGEAGEGGEREKEADRTRVAASVTSSAPTRGSASHAVSATSHPSHPSNAGDASTSSLPSRPTPAQPSRGIPIQSTPLPPPPPSEEEEDATQPLFFPGGASQPSLPPTQESQSFVQPTPVSRGGDPGEFFDPSLHPPQTAQEDGDDEEEDSQRPPDTGPRKRFKPLF